MAAPKPPGCCRSRTGTMRRVRHARARWRWSTKRARPRAPLSRGRPNNTWQTPITDQAGNRRLMRGYLDTSDTSVTTVTVTGLPNAAYDVYVYADGDNGNTAKTAAYRISGAGITTTTINLTDAASANFDATFTQATNSNGNYVKFSVVASGFTLTATPGASSGNKRAPLNAVQIVPTAPPSPDFAISATPGSRSVTQGGGTTYTGHDHRAERVCGHGQPGGHRTARQCHRLVQPAERHRLGQRDAEPHDGGQYAPQQLNAHNYRNEWSSDALDHGNPDRERGLGTGLHGVSNAEHPNGDARERHQLFGDRYRRERLHRIGQLVGDRAPGELIGNVHASVCQWGGYLHARLSRRRRTHRPARRRSRSLAPAAPHALRFGVTDRHGQTYSISGVITPAGDWRRSFGEPRRYGGVEHDRQRRRCLQLCQPGKRVLPRHPRQERLHVLPCEPERVGQPAPAWPASTSRRLSRLTPSR